MTFCKNCKGTGKIIGPPSIFTEGSVTKLCPPCNGTKALPVKHNNWEICFDCDGWGPGLLITEAPPCSNCHGIGLVLPVANFQTSEERLDDAVGNTGMGFGKLIEGRLILNDGIILL
jgi:DnaJ-class molecular chaperone